MESIVEMINTALENCFPHYRVIIYSLQNEEDLFNLISNELNDCHKIQKNFENLIDENTVELFVILAIDVARDVRLGSYLAFSIENNENYGEEFIMLKLTCTDVKFRRRGLSTLLNIIPLYFAHVNGIKFVAVDVNSDSEKLFKSKFGFTSTGNYLAQFNFGASAFLRTDTVEFKKMIEKYVAAICKVVK